jgi:outer membrane murein-binding lipoprotein Lpp
MRKLLLVAAAQVLLLAGCSASDDPNTDGDASNNMMDMNTIEGVDLRMSDIGLLWPPSMGIEPGQDPRASIGVSIILRNDGNTEATGVECAYEIVPKEQTPWSQADLSGTFRNDSFTVPAGASENLSTTRQLVADTDRLDDDFSATMTVECSSPDEGAERTDNNDGETDEFRMQFAGG